MVFFLKRKVFSYIRYIPLFWYVERQERNEGRMEASKEHEGDILEWA